MKKPRVSKNEFAVAPLGRAIEIPGSSVAASFRLVGTRSAITVALSVLTAATLTLIGLRFALVATRPIVRSDWVDESLSGMASRTVVPATIATSSVWLVW